MRTQAATQTPQRGCRGALQMLLQSFLERKSKGYSKAPTSNPDRLRRLQHHSVAEFRKGWTNTSARAPRQSKCNTAAIAARNEPCKLVVYPSRLYVKIGTFRMVKALLVGVCDALSTHMQLHAMIQTMDFTKFWLRPVFSECFARCCRRACGGSKPYFKGAMGKNSCLLLSTQY
jgi:hypothetical protein